MSLMRKIGLGGLIHIWGNAGTGKTMFSIALACDESKYRHIEWINTDAKKSFATHLKRNVVYTGGLMNNIAVTFTENRADLHYLIDNLPNTLIKDTLVIIDPITRVLDMTHEDPILWGHDIIEVVLPTLAGVVNGCDADVVIISENRMMEDNTNRAVHHKSISRWVDHDLQVTRSLVGPYSKILVNSIGGTEEIATMKVEENGVIDITPRLFMSSKARGQDDCSVRD